MAAAPRPRCLVTAGSPLLASRTDSVAAATGFDGIPPPIQPGGDPPPLPWLSWATASDELSPPMWPCMGTKRGLSAAQMDPVESTAMAAAAGVLLVPRADMQLIKPINRHAADHSTGFFLAAGVQGACARRPVGVPAGLCAADAVGVGARAVAGTAAGLQRSMAPPRIPRRVRSPRSSPVRAAAATAHAHGGGKVVGPRLSGLFEGLRVVVVSARQLGAWCCARARCEAAGRRRGKWGG